MTTAIATAGGAARRPGADAAPARIALLGTGTVGRAVLERLASWDGSAFAARVSLVYAANSRAAVGDVDGLCPRAAQSLARVDQSPGAVGAGARIGTRNQRSGAVAAPASAAHLPEGLVPGRPAVGHAFPEADGTGTNAIAELPTPRRSGIPPSDLDGIPAVLHGAARRIVIDATASDAVADRHAQWLGQGIHVVTACKLGQGASLHRWRAIAAACAQGGTHYGDSATVGAGLPLLRSLRELQAGGDRIHAVAGVLSGSLAWLFGRYDGLRPFSGFVREARAAGYTEPDPRDDLSGEDVRRKLLILARSAGVALEAAQVEVESLVPTALAQLPLDELDAALDRLDAPLRERFAAAYKNGEKLRFIARLDTGGPQPRARVGLESLPGDDPLAIGAGADNRVAIWSDRYADQPLVIQGPGAGAGVTAAALLDDVLRIASAALHR